jgi:hypothetical protein
VAEELFTRPADLTLLSDAELTQAHTDAHAEFERVHGLEYTDDVVEYAERLTGDLDAIRVEQQARTVRANLTAEAQRDDASTRMDRLAARVNGPAPDAGGAAATDAEGIAEATAKGVTAALMQVLGNRTTSGKQMASLSAAANLAPDPGIQKQRKALLTVTNVDIPKRSLTAGANLPDLEALTDAVQTRAGGLPVTAMGEASPRYPVASVRNEYAHTVDERTGPAAVEALIRELTSRERQEALLAGGGWCAPSQIMYDLFNIADAPSGLLDLPTIGVSRGGIQFPTSPSIADVFFTPGASNAASGMGGFAFPFSNASDPWLWSEADDIATVTGSVNKPTLRVPCASFNNQRLEVYGLTLTAGNLTDSAYPEATANFLRLLRAAYAHTVNARLIGLMLSASSAAIAIGAANRAAFNTILDGVDLAATDYRNKFAMADDAILELVIPRWILAVIRADLAWRTAVELQDVSDQVIRGYFATRGISAQFVSDWQVRGAGQFGNPAALAGGAMTTWPTTVDFMLFAAGTFVHGTGLSLDLGVVRDSVLNAENDFTAAWMEEAHLIAKVGHESRRYTATFAVNGAGSLGQTLGAQL